MNPLHPRKLLKEMLSLTNVVGGSLSPLLRDVRLRVPGKEGDTFPHTHEHTRSVA